MNLYSIELYSGILQNLTSQCGLLNFQSTKPALLLNKELSVQTVRAKWNFLPCHLLQPKNETHIQ